MASIYKNNNIWYLSVFINGKRTARSLKTEDKKVANKLKVKVEYELIAELMGFKKQDKELSFKELSAKFLTQKTRSNSTQKIYENVFKSHIAGKPLPSNPNSRSIHIRAIHACWNWGLKKGLITKAHKLDMDTRVEPRQRTFSNSELKICSKILNLKASTGLFSLPTILVLEAAKYALFAQKMFKVTLLLLEANQDSE